MPEKYDIAAYEDLSYQNGDLNISVIQSPATVHGPGRRFCLWLQGCMKRCPSCINPNMRPLKDGQRVSQEELIFKINRSIRSASKTEGITLMGGEPTLQARNLVPVLESVKNEHPDYNILLFSGYLHETLKNLAKEREALNKLLGLTDTLIDGVYEDDSRDFQRVAGSSNQNIIHLTDALSDADFSRMGEEYAIKTGANISCIETGINIK